MKTPDRFPQNIFPGLGEIGVPMRVGGLKVESEDWLLGDDDGGAVLPQKTHIREKTKEGRTLAQVTDLLRWTKKA